MATNLKGLIARITEFRDKRDWRQFHTLKNLTVSLSIEVNEVLELFQWVPEKEVEAHAKRHKKELSYELADVFIYLLLLSDEAGIDLVQAVEEKLELNNEKYPLKKSKGSAKKYTEL